MRIRRANHRVKSGRSCVELARRRAALPSGQIDMKVRRHATEARIQCSGFSATTWERGAGTMTRARREGQCALAKITLSFKWLKNRIVLVYPCIRDYSIDLRSRVGRSCRSERIRGAYAKRDCDARHGTLFRGNNALLRRAIFSRDVHTWHRQINIQPRGKRSDRWSQGRVGN